MAVKKGRIIIVIILVIVAVAVIIGRFMPRIPANSILEMTISGTIAEQEWPDFSARFWEGDVTVFRHLLEALERAQRDDHVTGISLEIKDVRMNFGKVQEMRRKLGQFVHSGKSCTAYLEQASNLSYYLASACPEIYLTPTSEVRLTGLMGHTTFLRGTLDKLHIYPDLYHIAEYKTAKNILTEKQYTRAHEEVVRSMLTTWQAQLVEGIAASRNLGQREAKEIVREGPYLAEEAVERKLIDKLLYADEYRDLLKEKVGGKKLHTTSVSRYLEKTSAPEGPSIGLVYGTGTIITGKSGYDPGIGRYMGSDTVAAALRDAREDKSVKAIVFRVDSGGGSALASEIIRREVLLAKKQKPVVISMSDVAASGGYWIAMSADKIVANPGTVTGSIGVVYGKMNVRGFYNLLGMTADHLALASNSTFDYPFQNYTPQQRATVLRFMERVYDNFLEGVSQGRGISIDEVQNLAKGRVWLGSQAKERGLVDNLGGLDEAVALAKELADVPAQQAVQYKIFPQPKTIWEQLSGWLGLSSSRGIRGRLGLDSDQTPLLRERSWVILPFMVRPR